MKPRPHQGAQRGLTVSLLGVPNAGKSTLLNAILETKIAAVHRKPQMTRKNQLGIYTDDVCQLVFIDTPGAHRSDRPLNRAMMKQVRVALGEADRVAVLLEIQRDIPEEISGLVRKFSTQGSPFVILLNKSDLPGRQWVLDPKTLARDFGVPVFLISALKGHGVKEVIDYFKGEAAQRPFLYGSDDLTMTPLRDLAADCIREKLMEYLHKEIPYESEVIIESYEEGPKKVKISAVIMVKKKSQKGIVLGQGGSTIARIREDAEAEFKKIVGMPVVFHLFVKVGVWDT